MWFLYLAMVLFAILFLIGAVLLVIKCAFVLVLGSQFVFSVALALLVNKVCPLFEIGIFSVLAWSVIFLFATFLLGFIFPRLNCAYHFISASLVPYMVTYIVIEYIVSFILSLFQIDFGYNIGIDTASRIVCLAIGVFAAYRQFDAIDISDFSASTVGRFLDRAFASLLYGIGAVFLICLPVYGVWFLPNNMLDFMVYAVLGVTVIGYFIFDCKLTGSRPYTGNGYYSSIFASSEGVTYDSDSKPSLTTRLLTGNYFGLSRSEMDEMIDNQL